MTARKSFIAAALALIAGLAIGSAGTFYWVERAAAGAGPAAPGPDGAGTDIVADPLAAAAGLTADQMIDRVFDETQAGLFLDTVIRRLADEQAAALTELLADRVDDPDQLRSVIAEEYRTVGTARRDDLIARVKSLYREIFTDDELAVVYTCFFSPHGQTALQKQQYMARQTTLAGREWGIAVNAEVSRNLAARFDLQ